MLRFFFFFSLLVAQLFEALCYKPGSIPDSVTGFFFFFNPSGRPVALGLTQSLTEMSTRNISWW
jgi:hypothetical protein